jgi:arylsulfatase A-like enzyme
MKHREDMMTGARIAVFLATVNLSLIASVQGADDTNSQSPNVLLITIDDLNDWVGCLGGHPQSITPNIDSLAERGILFSNAHCNGPICNPSRVSFMTGIRPSSSGIFLNSHNMRGPGSKIRDATTIPQHFARHGYETFGCGKVFHGSKGRDNFRTYGPAGGQGPLPRQKLNCPNEQTKSRLWDWGTFPVEESAEYNDVATANWAVERLTEHHQKPFLLATGFYRPHVPFFAPKRFFGLHPRAAVKLPPVLVTDRTDIPPFALKLTDNPLPPKHEWFVSSGQWQDAVRSYLACISFADDNVGKLISALDAGPSANNTWILLLSDHGFFLGEKQRWAKQALWERATRVPLIIVPPKQLADQFSIGRVCSKPVELLSIFPTLVEACELSDALEQLEGHSLTRLLQDPKSNWPYYAITTHNGDNHAVRDDRYRYIRYADGSEELYDLVEDPNEWENLAGDQTMKRVIERLSAALP